MYGRQFSVLSGQPPFAVSRLGSRSRVCGCLIAFMVLVLPQARAGGAPPACPPLTGYRVIYNAGGDRRFHLVPTTSALTRAYSAAGTPYSPPPPPTPCMCDTFSGSTLPLVTVTDTGGSSGYLAEILGAQTTDSNIPLEIGNQRSGGGGATPSTLTSGFGGIDIIQNTVATKVGSTVTNYPSPYLRLCAQEITGSGSGSATTQCWKVQVTGQNVQNPPDIIDWTRETNNLATNITMRFPAAINLAAAANTTVTPNTAGQMTVGPAPVGLDNANVPSTFTGATTSSGNSGAAAGPVTVEPGQLTANGGPDPTALEGALQILQSYKTTGTTTAGLLACPTTTAQTATACSSVGQAENWVGVFNNIAGQLTNGSVTATPLRYGRVPISSVSGTNRQYSSGDFVCKDDVNAGNVIDNNIATNSNMPCPLGESVGIAVGDASSGTSHLVDLVPEPSHPTLRNVVTQTEEFMSNSITSTAIGELGWSTVKAGAGTATSGKIVGVTGHPGLFQVGIAANTAANTISALALGATTALPIAQLSGVPWRASFIAKSETTSSVTVRMGFGDSPTSPMNGVYFQSSSPDWLGVTNVGGTTSTITCTSAGFDNNFHTFEIRNDPTSFSPVSDSVTFWVDGTQCGTTALTSVPTSVAVLPFFHVTNTVMDSNTRELDIDAFQLAMVVSR